MMCHSGSALRLALLVLVLSFFAPATPANAQTPEWIQRESRCDPTLGREAHRTEGRLKAGERLERRVGPFIFRLDPIRYANAEIPVGWHIKVMQPGRDEILSRFTLPLAAPNDTDIVGGHFRNDDNTGPDVSTLYPDRIRRFIFSPEVGRTITYDPDATVMLPRIAKIEAFGRGTLVILDYALTPPQRGTIPSFLWMKFTACLTWPQRPVAKQ